MRISEYLTEHPNLWIGEPDRVTFLCPQSIMNDVVEIIKPERLRLRMAEVLRSALKKYEAQ